MKLCFTKGKEVKLLTYTSTSGSDKRFFPHTVSRQGSDKQGRIQIQWERHEEFGTVSQAMKVLQEWKKELLNDGWELAEEEEKKVHVSRVETQQKPKEHVPGAKVLHAIICLTCGKELLTTDRRKKYCSKECYKNADNKKHKPAFDHAPRKCKCCGKEFRPESKVNWYCSRHCKSTYIYQRAKKRMEARKEHP